VSECEAGVGPVDDELLDAVAGGVPYLFPETVFEKFR
jgi:hypothetical protein